MPRGAKDGREPLRRAEDGRELLGRAEDAREPPGGAEEVEKAGGAKPRKKTPVGALSRPHRSRPRRLEPSPEPEKTRTTQLFIVLQVRGLIFWRLFWPTSAFPSPSKTTGVKPSLPSPSPGLAPTQSKPTIAGILLGSARPERMTERSRHDPGLWSCRPVSLGDHQP